MNLLAIDTSGGVATVALGSESGMAAEYHFAHNMNLLQRLTPAIENVISDTRICVNDLDGVVVSLGPGSFTGLRVGVTAAKTLAWSLDIPIVGVDTLCAIYTPYLSSRFDYACALIHSKTGECYWSAVEVCSQKQIVAPSVADVSSIAAYLKGLNGSVVCCGNGALRNCSVISGSGKDIYIASERDSFARGAVLLEIGLERFRTGQMDDPMTLTPVYIKKPTPVVLRELAEQGQKTDE